MRIKRVVGKLTSVSTTIWHAVFTADGVHVSLHCSVAPSWKPRAAAPTAATTDPCDNLPCRVVFSAAGGGMELLQCTVCDRLFTTVHRYSGHACEGEVLSTVLGRRRALAVERAHHSAPLPIVALTDCGG